MRHLHIHLQAQQMLLQAQDHFLFTRVETYVFQYKNVSVLHVRNLCFYSIAVSFICFFTCLPSSSPRRAATGVKRSSSTTSPFGRPKWLARRTFAPCSARCLIVGSADGYVYRLLLPVFHWNVKVNAAEYNFAFYVDVFESFLIHA